MSCVTDGEHYAHGKTLRECRRALIFKKSDRDVGKYRGIGRDVPHTLDEMAVMYRDITGSCAAGINAFIASLGDGAKEHYTVDEAIGLVTERRAYRHDVFKAFFREGGAG